MDGFIWLRIAPSDSLVNTNELPGSIKFWAFLTRYGTRKY
jgi:hypothetical protein